MVRLPVHVLLTVWLYDPQTGEIMDVMLSYLPTHFKQPTDGAILPVENPEVWIYHEGVEP